MFSVEALENWIASDSGRLLQYRMDVIVIMAIIFLVILLVALTWGKKYDDARMEAEEDW